MKERIMKYVGIVIMLLAHPIGYNLWESIIWIPYIYPGDTAGYSDEQFAALISVGILEIFLVGLALFITGMLLSNKRK